MFNCTVVLQLNFHWTYKTWIKEHLTMREVQYLGSVKFSLSQGSMKEIKFGFSLVILLESLIKQTWGRAALSGRARCH